MAAGLAWLERRKPCALIGRTNEGPRQWQWGHGGHSVLVEIFLSEGDSGAALAEARSGGCTESLWMEIARAREAEHPRDAISIYQARIDPIVKRMDNRAYDEAAALAGKIGTLMKHCGQVKAFSEWIDSVRMSTRRSVTS